MRELRATAHRTWRVVEWGLSRAVMERIMMMMRTQTALSALPWLLPKALPPAPSLPGPPGMCTASRQCSPGTACACPAEVRVRAVLHEESDLRTMPRLHSNVARRRVWHSSGSSSACLCKQSEGIRPSLITQSECMRQSLRAAMSPWQEDDMAGGGKGR